MIVDKIKALNAGCLQIRRQGCSDIVLRYEPIACIDKE